MCPFFQLAHSLAVVTRQWRGHCFVCFEFPPFGDDSSFISGCWLAEHDCIYFCIRMGYIILCLHTLAGEAMPYSRCSFPSVLSNLLQSGFCWRFSMALRIRKTSKQRSICVCSAWGPILPWKRFKANIWPSTLTRSMSRGALSDLGNMACLWDPQRADIYPLPLIS